MTQNKKTRKIPKKNKKSQIKQDTTSKLLLVIFLVLCVVVFILATIMIVKNTSSKNDKYDIRVPLTDEELSSGVKIKISMDDVSKNQSKEYRIQVTNYVNDIINEKVMKYQIKVSPSNKKDKVDIELYSNKDNFELLQGKNKITDLSIGKDKKETITYTLKLTQREEPRDKQYVKLDIVKEE